MLHDFASGFKIKRDIPHKALILGGMFIVVPGHVSTQQVPLLMGTGALAGVDHF